MCSGCIASHRPSYLHPREEEAQLHLSWQELPTTSHELDWPSWTRKEITSHCFNEVLCNTLRGPRIPWKLKWRTCKHCSEKFIIILTRLRSSPFPILPLLHIKDHCKNIDSIKKNSIFSCLRIYNKTHKLIFYSRIPFRTETWLSFPWVLRSFSYIDVLQASMRR